MVDSSSGTSMFSGAELPAWALFFVPVGVSVFVIGVASAVLLSGEAQPEVRPPLPSLEEASVAHLESDEPPELASPPRQTRAERREARERERPAARRRRGFSPVIRDEEPASVPDLPETPPPPEPEVRSPEARRSRDEVRDAVASQLLDPATRAPFLRGLSRNVARLTNPKKQDAPEGEAPPGDASDGNSPEGEAPVGDAPDGDPPLGDDAASEQGRPGLGGAPPQ